MCANWYLIEFKILSFWRWTHIFVCRNKHNITLMPLSRFEKSFIEVFILKMFSYFRLAEGNPSNGYHSSHWANCLFCVGFAIPGGSFCAQISHSTSTNHWIFCNRWSIVLFHFILLHSVIIFTFIIILMYILQKISWIVRLPVGLSESL